MPLWRIDPLVCGEPDLAGYLRQSRLRIQLSDSLAELHRTGHCHSAASASNVIASTLSAVFSSWSKSTPQ
jgi:hypothetical protein